MKPSKYSILEKKKNPQMVGIIRKKKCEAKHETVTEDIITEALL